ncbi:MAG: hypothetical protein ACI86H_002206 [bacterium]|jgi:hypothetical protein
MFKLLPPLKILFLLVVLFIAPTLYAQSNTQGTGSILTKISKQETEDSVTITIKGELDPSKLGQVVLSQTTKTKKFTLKIPGAVLNPDKLQQLIEYSDSLILKQIRLKEDVKEAQGTSQVVFLVNVEISTKEAIIPSLIQATKTGGIVIKLVKESSSSSQSNENNQSSSNQEGTQASNQSSSNQEGTQASNQSSSNQEGTQASNQSSSNQEGTQASNQSSSNQEGTGNNSTTSQENNQTQGQNSSEQENSSSNSIKVIYRKPALMQVSIFNASGKSKRAFKLSNFLAYQKKKAIERALGIRFEIINISNAHRFNYEHTVIYFRKNFLKPALLLAKLIPGDQRVARMVNPDNKSGVDIEIFLGKDYK